jgi:hypothetical protein
MSRETRGGELGSGAEAMLQKGCGCWMGCERIGAGAAVDSWRVVWHVRGGEASRAPVLVSGQVGR